MELDIPFIVTESTGEAIKCGLYLGNPSYIVVSVLAINKTKKANLSTTKNR